MLASYSGFWLLDESGECRTARGGDWVGGRMGGVVVKAVVTYRLSSSRGRPCHPRRGPSSPSWEPVGGTKSALGPTSPNDCVSPIVRGVPPSWGRDAEGIGHRVKFSANRSWLFAKVGSRVFNPASGRGSVDWSVVVEVAVAIARFRLFSSSHERTHLKGLGLAT